MEEKGRNMLIDAARVVCAVLVIAIHTRPWSDINFYVGHFVANVLARLAVPLFFMLSGYFLSSHLGREGDGDAYLGRYLKSLLRIYAVWSLVYLPYDFHRLLDEGYPGKSAAGEYLRRFFIEGGHFHLWFFPALIYAVMILGFACRRKMMVALYAASAILYLVGLAAEPYRVWAPEASFFPEILAGVKELGTSRSALFFALPFLALGFHGSGRVKRYGNGLLAAAFTIFFLALAAESFYLENELALGGFNLYLFLVPAAYLAFLLLVKNPRSFPSINQKFLRDLSLLMYCSHGLFLIFAEEHLPRSLSNSSRFLSCALLTFAFSMIVWRWERLRKLLT